MNNPVMESLIKDLLDGNRDQAIAAAAQLCREGVSREQIIVDGIETAMAQMDAKCTLAQFNLLEIMLVGRALTAVVNELYPHGIPASLSRGTVVVGSLEGDVHDIGKNILRMVVAGKGYNVIDCGRDCPVETLVNAAEKNTAFAILISGLITSVIPQVRTMRDQLAKRGLSHIKVITGGAALKQASAENLNVDYVARTAFDGALYLEKQA
jgi:dimethylamine corrinoid protein